MFIVRGAKTAHLDPDSGLLNDRYLGDNNGESFGKSRLENLSSPTTCPDISEEKFTFRARSISARTGDAGVSCEECFVGNSEDDGFKCFKKNLTRMFSG